ncbi:twin-arginine translocation signal domain-containing protein [Eoetvoesia caeni]|nr:twin-arginine translocation signal domain-containing protein [Eoetvoesiella caeni]
MPGPSGKDTTSRRDALRRHTSGPAALAICGSMRHPLLRRFC